MVVLRTFDKILYDRRRGGNYRLVAELCIELAKVLGLLMVKRTSKPRIGIVPLSPRIGQTADLVASNIVFKDYLDDKSHAAIFAATILCQVVGISDQDFLQWAL